MKKILAVILCLVLAGSMLPVRAAARSLIVRCVPGGCIYLRWIHKSAGLHFGLQGIRLDLRE